MIPQWQNNLLKKLPKIIGSRILRLPPHSAYVRFMDIYLARINIVPMITANQILNSLVLMSKNLISLRTGGLYHINIIAEDMYG